jgi:hypothetical protein
MKRYTIIAGTTAAIPFQLIDEGSAVDLTSLTVTLLLADRTGTTVSNPGTIAETSSSEGRITLTPTNSSVFVAANGPYLARWVLTDGSSKVYYLPDVGRDIWEIIEA